jgi:OOP family OmpA-OmpF porin
LDKTIVNAALIAVLGSCAFAASGAANDAYLFDTRGVVVKSGTGLCWRTTRWTPAMAIEECDPDLIKKEAPPAPKQAVPVEPPKVTPAPAPVAAPTPPPAPKVITLAAKSLFDFNKAVLKPTAQAEIDREIIAKLQSIGKIRLILVNGHADRLGSAAYNQKLSEKRAEAVKTYLVSKGLDANSIETFGFGKTQPAQGVPKCEDSLPRKKLIECLEPHRRVSVEIQAAAK